MSIAREIQKIPGAITRALHGRPHVAVYNYHQVSESFCPQRHTRETWTSQKTFTASVRFLHSRMPIISLIEAIERLRTGPLDRNYAVLTFDDGDNSIAEQALPWLQQQQIPATLFVNSGVFNQPYAVWITIAQALRQHPDSTLQKLWTPEYEQLSRDLRHCDDAEFYRDGTQKIEALVAGVSLGTSRFLSYEALSQLDSHVFHVGLHGRDHERFIHKSAQWQQQALRDDQTALQDLPGYIPVFAAPFGRGGDWSYETLRIAWELGLEVVLADGGVNYRRLPALQRIPSDRRHVARLWRKNRRG